MRRFWVMSLLSVLLACVSQAQYREEDQRPNPDADRQTLLNLESGIDRAIQLNNASFFNLVSTDDFTSVLFYGETMTKPQYVRHIQNSTIQYDFVRSTDVQVKLLTDTAVVTSLRTEKGHNKGQAINRQFRVVRIYLNTPRGWKVLVQQETQLIS